VLSPPREGAAGAYGGGWGERWGGARGKVDVHALNVTRAWVVGGRVTLGALYALNVTRAAEVRRRVTLGR
jgi:hypothetical protein